jgi:hypothetical protein
VCELPVRGLAANTTRARASLSLQERAFCSGTDRAAQTLEQHRWMMATPIKILHSSRVLPFSDIDMRTGIKMLAEVFQS